MVKVKSDCHSECQNAIKLCVCVCVCVGGGEVEVTTTYS